MPDTNAEIEMFRFSNPANACKTVSNDYRCSVSISVAGRVRSADSKWTAFPTVRRMKPARDGGPDWL